MVDSTCTRRKRSRESTGELLKKYKNEFTVNGVSNTSSVIIGNFDDDTDTANPDFKSERKVDNLDNKPGDNINSGDLSSTSAINEINSGLSRLSLLKEGKEREKKRAEASTEVKNTLIYPDAVVNPSTTTAIAAVTTAVTATLTTSATLATANAVTRAKPSTTAVNNYSSCSSSSSIIKDYNEELAEFDAIVYGLTDIKRALFSLYASKKLKHMALIGPSGCGKSMSIVEFFRFKKQRLNRISLATYTNVNFLTGTLDKRGNIAACLDYPGRPIFLFDNLDKIYERENAGELEGVLTDLLDGHLTDQCLGSIDVSQAVFIFTLNDETKLGEKLREQLITYRISGLSNEQRKQAVNNFFWPKTLKSSQRLYSLQPGVIDYIVQQCANSSLRILDRDLYNLICGLDILADEESSSKPGTQQVRMVTLELIRQILPMGSRGFQDCMIS